MSEKICNGNFLIELYFNRLDLNITDFGKIFKKDGKT